MYRPIQQPLDQPSWYLNYVRVPFGVGPVEVEVDRRRPTSGRRKNRPGLALRRDGGRRLLLQRRLGRHRTLAEVGGVLFGGLAALRVIDQPLVACLLGRPCGLVEVLVVPATTNLKKTNK